MSNGIYFFLLVKSSAPFPVIDLCPSGQQFCSIAVDACVSVGCFVQNTRPPVKLTWISFEGGRILPSVYDYITLDNITFTSKATLSCASPQLSSLNVFVCQSSSIPRDLIMDQESSILIDKPFNYTVVGSVTVKYIEVLSTMALPCFNKNDTVFIWKKLNTGTDLWSAILYNIPPPRAFMESYFSDFEVDNEGSLMVKSVDIEHEGLYACIHNKGRKQVKLYDVKTYGKFATINVLKFRIETVMKLHI